VDNASPIPVVTAPPKVCDPSTTTQCEAVDANGRSATRICDSTTSTTCATVLAGYLEVILEQVAGYPICMVGVIPTTAGTCNSGGYTLATAQNSAGGVLPVACDNSVAVAITTATTTQIVAVSGTTSIYVCAFHLYAVSGTAPSLSFEYGTSTNCTGTHALTGTYSAIVGELTSGSGLGYLFHTPAGANGLCIVTGGTTPSVQGFVTYAQF
jgi:hypothetical protein